MLFPVGREAPEAVAPLPLVYLRLVVEVVSGVDEQVVGPYSCDSRLGAASGRPLPDLLVVDVAEKTSPRELSPMPQPGWAYVWEAASNTTRSAAFTVCVS